MCVCLGAFFKLEMLLRAPPPPTPYVCICNDSYGPQDLSLIGGLLFHNSAITALDISSNPLTTPSRSLVLQEVPIPPFDELTGFVAREPLLFFFFAGSSS